MSDTHGHGHDHGEKKGGEVISLPPTRLVSEFTQGGHEVDHTPDRNLFGFLVVLSVVLLLAAAGVYQLFVAKAGSDLDAAASKGSSQLAAQAKVDESYKTGWGKVSREGKVVGYRMPITEAARLVVANPSRFAAAPAPEGWVHPDDAGKK